MGIWRTGYQDIPFYGLQRDQGTGGRNHGTDQRSDFACTAADSVDCIYGGKGSGEADHGSDYGDEHLQHREGDPGNRHSQKRRNRWVEPGILRDVGQA